MSFTVDKIPPLVPSLHIPREMYVHDLSVLRCAPLAPPKLENVILMGMTGIGITGFVSMAGSSLAGRALGRVAGLAIPGGPVVGAIIFGASFSALGELIRQAVCDDHFSGAQILAAAVSGALPGGIFSNHIASRLMFNVGEGLLVRGIVSGFDFEKTVNPWSMLMDGLVGEGAHRVFKHLGWTPELLHTNIRSDAGGQIMPSSSARVCLTGFTSGKKATSVRQWYEQTSPTTCVPTSLANALLSLRIVPSKSFLNKAILDADASIHGCNMNKLVEASQQFKGLSFILEKIGMLEKRTPGLLSIGKKTRTLDGLADMIKISVDTDHVVLVGVVFQRYRPGHSHGKHNIAITGYQIDKKGLMDVQVVDSSLGRFWMPVEHLLFSMDSHDVFKIRASGR